MTYEIIITEQADEDLRGIYEYIAFNLLSPDNAAGQLDRLQEPHYYCISTAKSCMRNKIRSGTRVSLRYSWLHFVKGCILNRYSV